jgi:hypothetical protein
MRRKTTKIAIAIATAAAIAAGGAALTANNSLPASVAGYGTSNISGATATSLKYTLSADGTEINSAALVFSGDMTGKTIKAGFGTDDLSACTVGSYDGSASTPVTCSGFTQDTHDSSTFNVAVTDT